MCRRRFRAPNHSVLRVYLTGIIKRIALCFQSFRKGLIWWQRWCVHLVCTSTSTWYIVVQVVIHQEIPVRRNKYEYTIANRKDTAAADVSERASVVGVYISWCIYIRRSTRKASTLVGPESLIEPMNYGTTLWYMVSTGSRQLSTRQEGFRPASDVQRLNTPIINPRLEDERTNELPRRSIPIPIADRARK